MRDRSGLTTWIHYLLNKSDQSWITLSAVRSTSGKMLLAIEYLARPVHIDAAPFCDVTHSIQLRRRENVKCGKRENQKS